MVASSEIRQMGATTLARRIAAKELSPVDAAGTGRFHGRR